MPWGKAEGKGVHPLSSLQGRLSPLNRAAPGTPGREGNSQDPPSGEQQRRKSKDEHDPDHVRLPEGRCCL